MATTTVETYEDGELVTSETVEVSDTPSAAERIEALEAEVQGIKDRASAEAAKATATAQGVGKAVAGE